jgi:hypothetical protein
LIECKEARGEAVMCEGTHGERIIA